MPGVVEQTGSVKRTMHVVRHSTAFLAFDRVEDALLFETGINGKKIADPMKTASPSLQAGYDYFAKVERAMSQVVPQNSKYPQQAGTIEKDSHYQQFLTNLEEEHNQRPSPLAQPSSLAPPSSKRDNKLTITALMEDVRSRRKDRETKRKPKSSPRPPRKSRIIHVEKSPDHVRVHHQQQHSPHAIHSPHPKQTPHGKKKGKRRGGEPSPSPVHIQRRNEGPSQERRGPIIKHSPHHVDRRNNTFPRQNNNSNSPSADAIRAVPTPPPRNSPYNSNNNVVAEPHTPNGTHNQNGVLKGPFPRQTNGRSRYNRGRGKGRMNHSHMAAGGGANRAPIPASDGPVGGSVRLLKKEASNVSKT